MKRLLVALVALVSLVGIRPAWSAEILIKLGPSGITDNNAWRRLCPVTVKPDNWAWGTLEKYPEFAIVRISDMTVEQLSGYLEPDIDNVTKIQRSIRKWKIDIDDVTLPVSFKNTITSGGIPSVTKTQVINYIKKWIP